MELEMESMELEMESIASVVKRQDQILSQLTCTHTHKQNLQKRWIITYHYSFVLFVTLKITQCNASMLVNKYEHVRSDRDHYYANFTSSGLNSVYLDFCKQGNLPVMTTEYMLLSLKELLNYLVYACKNQVCEHLHNVQKWNWFYHHLWM